MHERSVSGECEVCGKPRTECRYQPRYGLAANVALAAQLAKAPEPRPAKPHLSLAFKAMPVAGEMADAVSTDIALRRGAVELNPVLAPVARNRKALYGVKLGIGLGVMGIASILASHGHSTQAKVVCVVAGVVGAGLAAKNMRGVR